MSTVLIKFKGLDQESIIKIMRERLGYIFNCFERDNRRDSFLFGEQEFLYRVTTDRCVMHYEFLSITRELDRVAHEIGDYDVVQNVTISHFADLDRFELIIEGRVCESPESRFKRFLNENSIYGMPINTESLRNYFENNEKAIRDAFKRIPKTFNVYSGYSKDGRLRTVVHWQDGVKTSVYLKKDDFDDIYLAIAYCYVKRKFGTMSHFRRIVERNTKNVTGGVKRFIYGGDSTLLMLFMRFSIYDQVALYLAISYLGDTDQWLTEEDIKRLEDSVNE